MTLVPKVGDRVIVNGSKLGTLRFCGTTDFAPGVWAGVEYDEEEGKNDGTVKGVMYFKCPRNHGVFVLANKVAKAGKQAVREFVELSQHTDTLDKRHGIEFL